MTGEAEARRLEKAQKLEERLRASTDWTRHDAADVIRVLLDALSKAEQEWDSAKTFAYEMGKREGYAEGKADALARERELREALQAWYDWDGFGMKGQPIQQTRDALQATQEDVEA
jgi:hypothetical protein